MNLREFKDKIDEIIEQLPKDHSLEHYEVVVTVKDHAVGGRPKSNVKGIYQGFDWERMQIRIDTNDELWVMKSHM